MKIILGINSLLILLATISCNNTPSKQQDNIKIIYCDTTTHTDTAKYTKAEINLLKRGLVDIKDLDQSIAVHLVYSTPYNFMGKVLYNDINHAFMLKKTADMLVSANKKLQINHPNLKLIVYDAARPLYIQKKMWDMVKHTPMHIYVSDPAYGIGMHNYGAAVDVTIIDCAGNPISMGGTFDQFDDVSKIDHEQQLLSTGLITKKELNNRLLLREVMTKSGFKTYRNEWWHFNIINPREVKGKYQLIP